ncbi:MAG: glycoside hydrolase family 25 protein, partial [Clostridia bacterium]|nr:glycoside hydrolase family 25 protein [Clostridia bacterium]
ITLATIAALTVVTCVLATGAKASEEVSSEPEIEEEVAVIEEPELDPEVEELAEIPEEETQPDPQEDKTPPKTVTYKEQTVTIPKSTVAPVNAPEDPEKNKEKGGEEVKQEQVEAMFENVGKKSMGIDVSAHQGEIDWAKVKASGVDFAMIRVGYRGYETGKIMEDTYFKRNASGAAANGVKVGIYFYSAAINEKEALEEAAWVVSKIALYKITYPVVFDFEEFQRNRCIEVDGKVATKNALMFLNYVKSSGYEPMLYANKRDITNRFQKSSFSCKFWLAHYTEETDYKGSFNMWQYTSQGSVPGISGRVDMDIAYFTYGTVAEPKHTHDYKTKVGEDKKPTCLDEGSRTLRCSCGETETIPLEATGHSFGEWIVEITPTKEQEGLAKRVCTVCMAKETKEIDKSTENTEEGGNGNKSESEGQEQGGAVDPDPTPSEPETPTPETPVNPVPTQPETPEAPQNPEPETPASEQPAE